MTWGMGFSCLSKIHRTAMDNTTFHETWSVYMETVIRVYKRWSGDKFFDVFKRRHEVISPSDPITPRPKLSLSR